jgi:hypothetical protein
MKKKEEAKNYNFYLVVNLKNELSMDCVPKLAPLHTLVDF